MKGAEAVSANRLPALTVFVVDDERALGAMIGEILANEGFDTSVFHDPKSALAAIESAEIPPDVVVTDFAMAGLNGIELIRRSRERHPKLPTVMVSGSMTPDALAKAPIQPDSFIFKPFAPDSLVKAVRAAAWTR